MTVKYGEMVNLVNGTISIDQYKPKIGEANETVVLALEVMQEGAASDLSNLIETDVVETLDVDVSQGPNNKGNYLVFVEFQRNNKLHTSIVEMMKVVANVTTITEWQFEYYKGDGAVDLNEDNLKSSVLDNQDEYVLKYSQPKNEDLDRVKQLAGL
jgi:hypothetical protein|tara:strand:+ start:87 stop:554 length:468 start_codon:yes stop_codon:yes gene_type:complete